MVKKIKVKKEYMIGVILRIMFIILLLLFVLKFFILFELKRNVSKLGICF